MKHGFALCSDFRRDILALLFQNKTCGNNRDSNCWDDTCVSGGRSNYYLCFRFGNGIRRRFFNGRRSADSGFGKDEFTQEAGVGPIGVFCACEGTKFVPYTVIVDIVVECTVDAMV